MTSRFRNRHLHKSVADHIEAQLATLGWVTAPVNFGTVPLTFKEFEPDEPNPVEILPNTVSITLGDEPADEMLQLGGGLWASSFVLFVDIYGANFSIARSIASDVKDIVSDLWLPVLDYTNNSAGVLTTDSLFIERESVLVERPDASADAQDIRKNWRVVKAVVVMTGS